jgi:hypothetical protein
MTSLQEHYRAIVSGPRQWRQFALVLALAFLVVAGFTARHDVVTACYWLVPVLLVGGLAWLVPAWLETPHRIWMMLAGVLGFVMTRVILAVVFYLVLTPLALVSRIVGKRYLDLGVRDGRSTYWLVKQE